MFFGFLHNSRVKYNLDLATKTGESLTQRCNDFDTKSEELDEKIRVTNTAQSHSLKEFRV